MNHKHGTLRSLKICTLFSLCTLILSNSLHLTIGSIFTLIQNELWIPKYSHVHSKVLFLMFRVFKRCHQDFNLLHTYHTCYTSFFWVKSGEKWLTHSVFSPIYIFSHSHLVGKPLACHNNFNFEEKESGQTSNNINIEIGKIRHPFYFQTL
jgi:hypothetical protein